jgi:hypothetical protein
VLFLFRWLCFCQVELIYFWNAQEEEERVAKAKAEIEKKGGGKKSAKKSPKKKSTKNSPEKKSPIKSTEKKSAKVKLFVAGVSVEAVVFAISVFHCHFLDTLCMPKFRPEKMLSDYYCLNLVVL